MYMMRYLIIYQVLTVPCAGSYWHAKFGTCTEINFDHLFQNGNHPLWYASYHGRTDLVELLLIKSRANVNLPTEVRV